MKKLIILLLTTFFIGIIFLNSGCKNESNEVVREVVRHETAEITLNEVSLLEHIASELLTKQNEQSLILAAKTIVQNNLEEYFGADCRVIFSTLLPNFEQHEQHYLECLKERCFLYNHNIINGQVLATTTNGISFHIIMGKINVRPGTKLLYNGDKNEGISCEKEHQYLYFYLSILDRDDGKLIFKNVFPFAGNTNSDFFSKDYYEHFPQSIKSLIISVLPTMKRAEEKRINEEEEGIKRVELEKKMEMEKEAQAEKKQEEERLQSIKNIENNILRKLESAK